MPPLVGRPTGFSLEPSGQRWSGRVGGTSTAFLIELPPGDRRGDDRASGRRLLRSQGERRLQHLERAKHIEVDDEGTLRLFGLSP